MALVDITIDFDLAQLLGADFDARRTKAYVTTNVESGTLMDTSTGETRLGDEAVTINSDGTGSFTTWATGADGNPISWQTSLVVDYPRTGQRDRKRRVFGPWTLTTADDGKNITELEDEQAVPPEYLTTVTTALQTYVDAGQAAATTASAAATTASGAADTAVNAAGLASEIALGDADAAFGAAQLDPASPLSVAQGDVLDDPTHPLTVGLSNTFARVFTPQAYGAVGNGIADDTAAIQACLDAADAANGIAYIAKPPVEYLLTDTLTISNPMTVRCAPLAVMHWTGLTGTTPGIDIDYGDVTYNLGSYEFPILNGPVDDDLTAMTGTAVRVANGDIIQTKVNYVINWKVGIHHIADISNSENCLTRFEVMDRVETGLLLEAATGRYLDLAEISGNTIGISKWPIRFKTTGTGEVTDNRVTVQQVWQEIGGGTCIYGEGATGINRNVVEVPYVRSESTVNTPGAAFKEKWIGGDQTVNGETGFLSGTQNTFRFGGIPSNTDAAIPVRIKVSGFDNNLVSLNRDQESAAGITLSATQGEANFNSGLPLAANKFIAEVSVPANSAGTVLTYYAYSQLLTSEFGTAIKVLPTNAWGGHFDIWAEDNSATNNREIIIKIRMRDTTAAPWTARFLVEV